jgi:hypothetical protein
VWICIGQTFRDFFCDTRVGRLKFFPYFFDGNHGDKEFFFPDFVLPRVFVSEFFGGSRVGTGDIFLDFFGGILENTGFFSR